MSDSIIRAIHLPNSVSRRDLFRFSLAGAGLMALGPLARYLPTATGSPQKIGRAHV